MIRLSSLVRGITCLLILGLLVACVPVTPPPEPTKQPPEADKFSCKPGEGFEEGSVSRTGSHYVENQVIMTGPASAFDDLLEELSAQGIDLELLVDCDLAYQEHSSAPVSVDYEFGATRGQSHEPAPFTEEQREELVMRLYLLPEDQSSLEAISPINEIANELGVFADPNYLTGPMAISPCGDAEGSPFEMGGSPFEMGGSPFEMGGSPSDFPGMQADPNTFGLQWALQYLQVGPQSENKPAQSGRGVRVMVFDTSPFSPMLSSAVVSAIQPELSLQLTNPESTIVISPTNPAADVADHGLFVAGLIHAVAPESDITLIRVLNDFGCGDVFTLNQAIHQVISDLAGRETGQLDQVVFNLSLGVQQPLDYKKMDWPDEVVSLQEAIQEAHDRGAVIIAASGNDSPDRDPLPMNLPADYETVVGVSASTIGEGLACYSNVGQVAAPGADGKSDESTSCRPSSLECADDDPDCPYGLISLATESPTGYRFWVGTSFAAPLVAGQAALLRQAFPTANPSQIMERIFKHTKPGDPAFGNGIVKPAASLVP